MYINPCPRVDRQTVRPRRTAVAAPGPEQATTERVGHMSIPNYIEWSDELSVGI